MPNEMTAPEAISMSVGSDPAAVAFETLPTFDSLEDERRYRKEELALALRLFGDLGFAEEVAGHVTARDAQNPQRVWVNPFGVSLRRIKAPGLFRVDHDGKIIDGNRPVHEARPGALAAAHAHHSPGTPASSATTTASTTTSVVCSSTARRARGSARHRCTPRSSPSNRTCWTDDCPSRRDRPRQAGIAASR